MEGLGEPRVTDTTRRRVLKAAGIAALVVIGPPGWWRPAAGQTPPEGLASQIPVLRAYVSTLVPGPGDDPSGAPGGVEAGGVDAIVAHAPYVIPLVVADVNAAALNAHGVPFEALGYAAREALLVEAFADGARSPYHLIALALGAGAFYGDFYGPQGNRTGSRYLGFPGPSHGYLASFTDRTGNGQPEAEAEPG